MSSPSGRRPQRGGEAFPFFSSCPFAHGPEGAWRRLVLPSDSVVAHRGSSVWLEGAAGGVVLPEGSRPASSGVSFCSEGAGGSVSCLRTQVRPSRWNPIGLNAREASPGSAALPGGVRLARMGQQECSSIPSAGFALPMRALRFGCNGGRPLPVGVHLVWRGSGNARSPR